MYYHNITKDDMLNGDGLRVVLWVSGCDHNCKGCHNPQTHNPLSGVPFDIEAEKEIFEQLDKEYISGITFSGGDPLHTDNLDSVYNLINKIRDRYGNSKTIWIYSGYTLEDILLKKQFNIFCSSYHRHLREIIVKACDVFVDGRFVESLKDNQCHWVGSTNQRILRKGIDF